MMFSDKAMKLIILTVFLLGSVTGCKKDQDPAGLANPASVYCEEQGGTVDFREDESGTYGMCVFPDGTEIDEWEFYRNATEPEGEGSSGEPIGAVGLANPASVYCEEQGGTLDFREGENGTYGMCVFPDGTEIEEWELFYSAQDEEE